MKRQNKKAIVVGATSGLGYETALQLLSQGWTIGVAGRREERLKQLQEKAPERIHIKAIDICTPQAAAQLQELIDEMGGIDLYMHCSGIGYQNHALLPEIELNTLETNGTGFTRMITAAFNYFATSQRSGQIAIISSIAGTKGLGVAPAYSATKRFQNTYIDALEQLAHMKHLDIKFTDIRPGFVATELLNGGKGYPMLMTPEYAGKIIANAVVQQKRVKIVDWKYRLLVFFWKLIPAAIWRHLKVKN